MNHYERLQACLAGGPVDRPPVALWRHFPVDDQDPFSLASAALDFQRQYDFDLVKVTPASSFCIKDWGVQDEWRGDSEGTRTYTRSAVQHPEDWEKLKPLDPYQGHLAGQLECLERMSAELGPQTPMLQTIFSPLSQAKNLVGKDNLIAHLHRYPDALHGGLKIITETTQRFIEAAKKTGIAGLFYAVQHAQYGLLSVDEYNEFGRAYDLPLLQGSRDLPFSMLHLHGEQVMFDLVADYPVAMINWHDRDTPPSLQQGLKRFKGIVCGGLQRERSMVLGSPETVTAEARDAIQATQGKRFLLGTGCVLPIIAPRANILAARQSVEL